MHLTRRSVLGNTAAAAALAASPALARAPLAGALTPSYRLKVGDIEVTAFSDGYLDIGQEFFPARDPAEAAKLLERDFRPGAAAIRTSVNAFVVNTGDKLILLDAGSVQGFAPTLAKLPDGLAAAGFKPEQFDMVLATHLHPDHVGAMTNAGAARFTNAELVVAETELKFWTDEGIASRAPKDFQPFFAMAQGAAKPYAKVTRTFGKDGEIAKGITSLALPGHTPGHTGYMISSGADSLLIWGDIVHSPSLQFAHPEWGIGFDNDQAQAMATRKAIFDRASADKILVAGMHHDFPAFGHVAKDGAGFRFTPAYWRLDQ